MQYEKVPNIEIFAEALSVPPLMHVPADRKMSVAAIGRCALPLAKLALRYPSTERAMLVSTGKGPLPRDRRLSVVRSIDGLKGQSFDVVGMALPGDPARAIGLVRPLIKPGGILVVALDQLARGRAVKDAMQRLFRQVLVYREHVPEPALFLMAKDGQFGKPSRPMPPNLKRLTPRYLQGLFLLAKDEYKALYGGPTS